MPMMMTRPGPASGVVGVLTALDYDGSAPGRRMLTFSSPPSPVPLTLLVKVYQRQNSNRADGSSYYTTFFFGNNGLFVWGSGYDKSYYGAHPYPAGGTPKWELSAFGLDFVTRDDGSSPGVSFNAWHSQAFRVVDTGGNNYQMKSYINLPNVTTAWTITQTPFGAAFVTPPTPCICMGQAPDNGSGKSWGGYDGWEEQNARIRGISIYTSSLAQADILALESAETDAARASIESGLGLIPWFRNMNPTPTDITDKGPSGNHPTWTGAFRPALWTS